MNSFHQILFSFINYSFLPLEIYFMILCLDLMVLSKNIGSFTIYEHYLVKSSSSLPKNSCPSKTFRNIKNIIIPSFSTKTLRRISFLCSKSQKINPKTCSHFDLGDVIISRYTIFEILASIPTIIA